MAQQVTQAAAKPPVAQAIKVPRIHFISGFPRAGTTLLGAILRQNPRFHAGMTSPVGDMVSALIAEMSGKNDFSVFIEEPQRMAVLRSVFWSYYSIYPNLEVAFDTGRIWCSKMPMLASLFPNAKVIACVREMPWVLDSVERMVRKHPLSASKIFHFNPNGTVYSRTESLIDVAGMVGFSYQATKDAYYGEYAPGRLMLLTYESLTSNPQRAIDAIYQFIGEPPFKHDFDNIQYDEPEFDARLGLPGLHKVQPKVTSTKRESVLPPDLFNRFIKDSFWLDPATNIRKVPIV
ncbi:MAG: sulfotransferase family protein [Rhodanobacteraceae bacterium]